jgi:uncharacterized membrane protein SirB2
MIAKILLYLFIVLLVILPVAYLQYRAIKDLRGELAYARRTRKIHAYVVGYIGMIAFYGLIELLLLLSVLGVRPARWEEPIFVLVILLIVVGFVLGRQHVGRIHKKRLGRKAGDDATSDQSHF